MSGTTAQGPLVGGRVIGEDPKPRVLFSWDGPAAERVADVLDLHAPTVRVVASLRGVRQDDYDVLVTNRMDEMVSSGVATWMMPGAEAHLFVISFAQRGTDRSTTGRADFCADVTYYEIRWRSGYLSKAVEVPQDVLSAATDLVSDDLIPTVVPRQSHISFTALAWGNVPGSPAEQQEPLPEDAFILNAFLRTAGRDPEVLAGWYRRSERSEGWVLPADVGRPWDWVAAAIRHWAVTYGRFPLVGGWWEDPRWQTLAEKRATATRTKLKQELAEVSARLHERIAVATTDLEKAQQDAAGGRRRLLTDKGDSLKEATVEAFDQLGYRVTDRDQEQPHDAAGHIEDLGLVDPDEPSLDPIVEVKGYDRGAKAGDVGKMVRHLLRAKTSGRSPSAIWWVINHWRTQPPVERGLVLAGEDPLIAGHADDDVPLVVIDTAELFRAVRVVEEGQVTRDEVRASLRAARGRWEIDFLPGE